MEELEALIQAIKGQDISTPLFPPQNPFQDVPIRRIDTSTYIFIARQIIGRQEPDQTRTPGAEKPALMQELGQRCREVQRIIASLDREIEQIEARDAIETSLSQYFNTRQVFNDRDNLRTELQFYIDLIEALNYTPT